MKEAMSSKGQEGGRDTGHAPSTLHGGEPVDAHDQALALLAGLDGQGVAERHPVRWRYLQALTARLHGQPEAVQGVLLGRLKQGIAALEQDEAADPALAHVAATPVSTLAAVSVLRPPTGPAAKAARYSPSALGELNEYIQARTHAAEQRPGAHEEREADDPSLLAQEARLPPMKSVRRFGETWARIAAEHQVEQALKRAPHNAGPLNSHMLVLRTFSLMRELSPDYLRHFLGQVDSLLWLDQVHRQYAVADSGKAGRAPRSRK